MASSEKEFLEHSAHHILNDLQSELDVLSYRQDQEQERECVYKLKHFCNWAKRKLQISDPIITANPVLDQIDGHLKTVFASVRQYAATKDYNNLAAASNKSTPAYQLFLICH